jgi:surface antigen
MGKESVGTLIGGATGALIGSRFGKGGGALAATGVGALAGAFIGGQIGKTMDETDKRLASERSNQALETLPSGSSAEWKNPDSGNYGYITPQNTFKNHEGRYCREYTQTVYIGGEPSQAYGKACRKPDGSWEMTN